MSPVKSVATWPGQQAFTMTFVSASRRAYCTVRLLSMVFDDAYAARSGPACRVSEAMVVETFTMRGEGAR